jgi:hypothetical protein
LKQANIGLFGAKNSGIAMAIAKGITYRARYGPPLRWSSWIASTKFPGLIAERNNGKNSDGKEMGELSVCY